MNVGEVKEDDIIYARKIKAIADKWLPPLYAWRQHEETLSFPSLIRKITNELAPTFMIDHVAAAILVDIADSFFCHGCAYDDGNKRVKELHPVRACFGRHLHVFWRDRTFNSWFD